MTELGEVAKDGFLLRIFSLSILSSYSISVSNNSGITSYKSLIFIRIKKLFTKKIRKK